MNRIFILSLLFVFYTNFSFLYGQEDNSKEEIKYPKVSIHAEDTHLPSILAILAKESGYNIVTGPNVENQNKLTIHLDDVPIDQAINLVIRAAGLSYEIVGTSLLVANQSKINADITDIEMNVRVIFLSYISVGDSREYKLYIWVLK